MIRDMKFSKRKSCLNVPPSAARTAQHQGSGRWRCLVPPCGSSLPPYKTGKSEGKEMEIFTETQRPAVQKPLPPDISLYLWQAASFYPFIIAPFLVPFLLRLLPSLSSSFRCPIFPSCPHFTPLFHSSSSLVVFVLVTPSS